MQDLFTQTKSKKEQLLDWIKRKGRARTSDVIQWGLDNMHTRADRDARDLAEEGLIWRVKDSVKMCIAPKSKEEIWSTFPSDKETGILDQGLFTPKTEIYTSPADR